MKKIFLITSFLALTITGIKAQSISEGNDNLYYERYQSAAQTFEQLTKADPSNAENWFGLAKAYLLMDKESMANEALLKAPASVQGEPLFEVAKGWTALSDGDKNAADQLFSDALQQTREKNAGVLSAVAQAQIDAGNGQYAVDLLNKAIKREKHNAGLYVQLGDAYRKMLNGSEAYQAYKKAIEDRRSSTGTGFSERVPGY